MAGRLAVPLSKPTTWRAQLPRLVELELAVGRAHGTEALHASQIVGAIHHLERTPVVYSRRP